MNTDTKQNGFIALILVLMVSSLTTIFLIPLSASAVVHRLTIAVTEEKIQARYLADACAYEALVQLAYDKNYPGNEILAMGCSIEPIPPPNNGVFMIHTRAEINKHNAASLIAVSNDLSIISWQEE